MYIDNYQPGIIRPKHCHPFFTCQLLFVEPDPKTNDASLAFSVCSSWSWSWATYTFSQPHWSSAHQCLKEVHWEYSVKSIRWRIHLCWFCLWMGVWVGGISGYFIHIVFLIQFWFSLVIDRPLWHNMKLWMWLASDISNSAFQDCLSQEGKDMEQKPLI